MYLDLTEIKMFSSITLVPPIYKTHTLPSLETYNETKIVLSLEKESQEYETFE